MSAWDVTGAVPVPRHPSCWVPSSAVAALEAGAFDYEPHPELTERTKPFEYR